MEENGADEGSGDYEAPLTASIYILHKGAPTRRGSKGTVMTGAGELRVEGGTLPTLDQER